MTLCEIKSSRVPQLAKKNLSVKFIHLEEIDLQNRQNGRIQRFLMIDIFRYRIVGAIIFFSVV